MPDSCSSASRYGTVTHARSPRSHTWYVPIDSSVEERKTKRYLQLLWVSPVLVTLLGVFFLFVSDEKPWLPWLAFVLAIVNVIANIVETRKVRAKSAQKESDSSEPTDASAAK